MTVNQDSLLAPNGTLAKRIGGHKLPKRPANGGHGVAFYRHLDEALDGRRSSELFYSIVGNTWQTKNDVDLCSGDIVSLRSNEVRRAAFLAEMTSHPDFATGSSGVRLMDGNYAYLEQVEAELAAFHGAETGLIVGSAFEANVAVWTALPRKGDVIVHDALVHASSHDGFKKSAAASRVRFRHNDVDDFRSVVRDILSTQPAISKGEGCILVAVESIYSMDGDVCPLRELVDVAREESGGLGNIQFVVDEAHSVGVVGPRGAGLVCELGLQDEIAVVVHSFGKALGAIGAVILGRQTVKDTLMNLSRSIIYTTSASFPVVAAIRSGYAMLATDCAEKARQKVQHLAKLFFKSVLSHPRWPEASKSGLLRVPLATGWEERDFQTHILAVSTRHNYTYWLYFHVVKHGFSVFPVQHPLVPRGKGRLRVILHAHNTEQQVLSFIDSIFAWVEEMMEIEKENGQDGNVTSSVAGEVYTWMKGEGLSGFGMV